jgi:hypothetical protein
VPARAGAAPAAAGGAGGTGARRRGPEGQGPAAQGGCRRRHLHPPAGRWRRDAEETVTEVDREEGSAGGHHHHPHQLDRHREGGPQGRRTRRGVPPGTPPSSVSASWFCLDERRISDMVMAMGWFHCATAMNFWWHDGDRRGWIASHPTRSPATAVMEECLMDIHRHSFQKRRKPSQESGNNLRSSGLLKLLEGSWSSGLVEKRSGHGKRHKKQRRRAGGCLGKAGRETGNRRPAC